MATQSKIKPPSVPKVKKVDTNLKGSTARVVAWAKKNPALAALLVGGVILLAFVVARRRVGVSSAGLVGDGDGVAGGLGGLASDLIASPTTSLPTGALLPEDLFSDFVLPEFTYPEFIMEEPTTWYYEEDPSSWYYEDEGEQVGELASDLSAWEEDVIGGFLTQFGVSSGEELAAKESNLYDDVVYPQATSLLTNIGALIEDRDDTSRKSRTTLQQRQQAESAKRGTTWIQQAAQAAGTRVSLVQQLIDRMKSIATPQAPRVEQRQYSRQPISSTSTVQQQRTRTTAPATTVGPRTKPAGYDTFAGQFAYFQDIVKSREQTQYEKSMMER